MTVCSIMCLMEEMPMKLNNVMIFGDSYSTYRYYIPEEYPTFYADEPFKPTDVNRVEQTWWHQLFTHAGAHLVQNNSWSGSTIGYTGYGGANCSGTSSFIFRLRKLKAEGFFAENRIDTVFVFGGTNDSWCGAPTGEPKYSDWEEADLFFSLPAAACFLHELKETLPNAEIVVIINTNLKQALAAVFKESCARLGLRYVELKDIDKTSGHPTVLGMSQIKEQIVETLGIESRE